MSDETAESRLAKTLFVVEATSFEQYCLWAETATESNCRRFEPRRWEQVHPGWIVTVGRLDSRPVCVSMCWNRIDGHLVMFWEATSQVVDTVQIEKWLSQHFSGKWDKGTREATTNAANFHHCLHAIDDANARLIAAAPELLEACLLVVDACGDWGQERAFRAIQAARDAIATARGERSRCEDCNKRLGDEERGHRICELCSSCVPCPQESAVESA